MKTAVHGFDVHLYLRVFGEIIPRIRRFLFKV